MESWNRSLFLALNAPAHPAPATILLALVLANWAIFLVPLLFAAFWLWGDPKDRAGLLLTFCAAELALGLNQVAAIIWYHPRPFAVPIGRTLVDHVADSSFPSDHVTFLIASGVGLMVWTHHRRAGLAILALSVPVAWARLYLGVHFPLDMVGAIPVAGLGLLIASPLRVWFVQSLLPRWGEPLYRAVFSVPIRKGWVHP